MILLFLVFIGIFGILVFIKLEQTGLLRLWSVYVTRSVAINYKKIYTMFDIFMTYDKEGVGTLHTI